jgi:hypothetical protein
MKLSRDFDHLNWMTTDRPIWFIAEHIIARSVSAIPNVVPAINLDLPKTNANDTNA